MRKLLIAFLIFIIIAIGVVLVFAEKLLKERKRWEKDDDKHNQ